MKKWTFSGVVAIILLLGSLVLLGSYFAADLFPVLSEFGENSTQSSSTEETTTQETTTQETTTEETTVEETTTEETTTLYIPPVEQETQDQVRTLTASHAFVYDLKSGEYLYEKGDRDQHIAPASVTKLLSAFVALQHLMPDTVLTVGSELALINPNSSIAGLLPGQQLTVEMCVQCMMMPSGNDAAYVLAVAAGRAIGGSDLGPRTALETFMNEVNRIAQLSGMKNTHFVNPDGMDAANHYTSPHDLVIMARLALQNSIILKYAGEYYDELTITSGQTLKLKNSNLLLDPNSKYYEPSACGLKTGTTSKAGACLLSVFRKSSGFLIVGTFGCSTDYARYEDTCYLYHTYQ